MYVWSEVIKRSLLCWSCIIGILSSWCLCCFSRSLLFRRSRWLFGLLSATIWLAFCCRDRVLCTLGSRLLRCLLLLLCGCRLWLWCLIGGGSLRHGFRHTILLRGLFGLGGLFHLHLLLLLLALEVALLDHLPHHLHLLFVLLLLGSQLV
jgi:hypothetical protein